ncbi:MAG: DUF4191 domain-containing protein [Candidatus Nanopelagicales bacterium]|nr:DUF4191 domain-containing protein [Candidatus Nanopelagicales bacterium]MDZ4250855.1 DUF4191 domain-containing protein [Candidatus Nanopelagicales bacterium]
MPPAPEPKKKRFAWVSQLRANFKMTRQVYPSVGWIMLGLFCVVLAVFILAGALIGNPATLIIMGVPLGLLAAMFYFSRKAMSAAYRQVEDQPGGAAAVAKAMRGNWTTTPGVCVTRNQDIVHRVVGRPGVILVSEGPSARVEHVLTSEKKRTQRYVPETPIHEIQVGTEDGQVPIAKLQRRLSRLPKALRPAEVTAVRRRLDAVTKQPAPIPKGPMPKSAKAARAQMRGR